MDDVSSDAKLELEVGAGPYGVALDPINRTVWVTNIDDDTASMIDPTKDSVRGGAEVGDHPRGVALDSATQTAWIANLDDGDMSVVDTTGRTLVRLPVGKI